MALTWSRQSRRDICKGCKQRRAGRDRYGGSWCNDIDDEVEVDTQAIYQMFIESAPISPK